MDRQITSGQTLQNLVDIDANDHKLKDITVLFLDAMNEWTTNNQTDIHIFIKELKEYFGTPLTIDKIDSRELLLDNDESVWRHSAGSSIADALDISTKFCSQSDFDIIIKNILNYYEQDFSIVDFIAELKYLTTEQGGRKTAAGSGIYRPQVKFDFSIMETSGLQTFIDKELVFPGETVVAKIKILSPNFYAGKLTVGMELQIREGERVVATGQLMNIINDKLIKASS